LICKGCKEEIPAGELQQLRDQFGHLVPPMVYRGKGCRNCLGTGFRGRQGVFEMMPITDEVRGLILQRASSPVIRKQAKSQGMSSLRGDGWRLIGEGRTTVEEVLRMTKDEDVATGMAELHASMVEDAAQAAMTAGHVK
jgi:type II secretory ATPase GspE/PulE/Tfp pilus assembly ATPase PilB-like protein